MHRNESNIGMTAAQALLRTGAGPLTAPGIEKRAPELATAMGSLAGMVNVLQERTSSLRHRLNAVMRETPATEANKVPQPIYSSPLAIELQARTNEVAEACRLLDYILDNLEV